MNPYNLFFALAMFIAPPVIAQTPPMSISVYPNPAITDLRVETAHISGVKTVGIFTMLGQQFYSVQTEEDVLVIDVSNITESQFFVVLRDSEGRQFTKVVSKL